jgi:adenine phosphoribosyltransferase
VVLIDDLLATGGTAGAASRLIRAMGGELAAVLFFIELTFLDGRKALENTAVHALISY